MTNLSTITKKATVVRGYNPEQGGTYEVVRVGGTFELYQRVYSWSLNKVVSIPSGEYSSLQEMFTCYPEMSNVREWTTVR